MITEKPKLVIGDIVIVYISRIGLPQEDEIHNPRIMSKTVTSIGFASSMWVFNYDTEPFCYDNVDYILRKGKWKHA